MKKFLTYIINTKRRRTAAKSGFGLIEVLAAAVILGFLLVGLTQLQKGNRESILRVRARDAANFVAQNVLDSLSGVGLNSWETPAAIEGLCDDATNIVYCNDNYVYNFEGKPQLDKTVDGIKTNIKYKVVVRIDDGEFKTGESIDSTNFTKANRPSAETPSNDEINIYSRNLVATVGWKFKESEQSITMAKVVR